MSVSLRLAACSLLRDTLKQVCSSLQVAADFIRRHRKNDSGIEDMLNDFDEILTEAREGILSTEGCGLRCFREEGRVMDSTDFDLRHCHGRCLEKKERFLSVRLFRVEENCGGKVGWWVVISESDGVHDRVLFSRRFKRLRDTRKAMDDLSKQVMSPCFFDTYPPLKVTEKEKRK